jgi:hypothetical protein
MGTTRHERHLVLGWMLVGLVVTAPWTAAAQVTLRPAERPMVTAASERWYLDRAPITLSGSIYYPAGPEVFFNPYEMVRSGSFNGVPLYAMTTTEPHALVYLPVGRGLMQPYERRRDGDVAGTVGSSVPSFPVHRDSEASSWGLGPQAAGPPDLSDGYSNPADSGPGVALATTGTGASFGSVSEKTGSAGPLTTALRPTGLNGFFINYEGQRWFSKGSAVVHDESVFTRTGEYRGFPVYVARGQPSDTIYVTVADGTTGLLTPYSTRR